LPLIYVPAFGLASRNRLRWIAGFSLVLLSGYAPLAWAHIPIFEPFFVEGALKSAGNLPYLIETSLGRLLPPLILDALLVLPLLVFYGITARSLRGNAVGKCANRHRQPPWDANGV
jgi:hypothetical protein